ncbi:MAG: RidA family protein [Promethearchaeota archaeon]
MVDIEIIDGGITKAGPYSHAVKTGNLIFVAGQIPSPGTTGIKEQTLSAFEKVKTILEAGGASVSNIVKVTVFLINVSDFSEMNQTYKDFFVNNGVTEKFPARTTVEISNLPLKGILLEIDVIAAI